MTQSPGLSLAEVAAATSAFGPQIIGDANAVVRGVHQDSRNVDVGTLFVARKGERSDGTAFIAQAVEAGAAAVMVERGTSLPAMDVPLLQVYDVRRALGFAAEAVYGNPSQQLKLVGITGTNGKTTTASLLRQCLVELGHPTAQLGTLGFEFGEYSEAGSLTTPEADAVTRFLAEVRARGASCAVMEVSSHALSQGRTDALSFEVGAFTNLSQDHLDYHGTMEAYGAAKGRLFTAQQPRYAVINRDDEFGANLSAPHSEVIDVGHGAAALIRAVRVEPTTHAMCLEVQVAAKQVRFETRLVGEHNVDNWLLTMGILHALGVDVAAVPEISKRVSPAPGRMERCEQSDDDISVLVDYAHTPDALERALTACRGLTDLAGSRLWCVFGCGGDRDKSKRPQMGAIAARLADVSVVTNDNPRTENPATIAAEIETGMKHGPGAYSVELDRAQAVLEAVSAARAGDVVLIAGKGHEDYQLVGGERFDFDDRQQARNALAVRRAGRGR